MRILFVTSTRLGDAVLSTGLLDHLIRTYPAARITVVCGPVAEGLFDRMPNRAATLVMEKRDWGAHWVRLWATVAPHLWDLVVDIRGSALSWLVPTRRRAVFRRRGGPKTAELAAILGLDPPPAPVAWFDDADTQRVRALLGPDRPFIALAPTANWPGKVWPGDRFAAAFRRLAGPDTRPVVLGAPGARERAMADAVLAQLPGAIDLVAKLSLPEVSACLARASLFIGNDSGLMHMAAAAGAPTVGLFGPTDADVYGPVGRRAIAVRGRDMDAITVDAVVDAARRLLE
ncbi:MAG TPA: glycosyltransferase family 9 protein [Rhodopila sp.]|uniref:glycosyltransferase family 9 protein n=1 Tax=Rhodopila sp. TaxID=2480087 RepID=UPI002B81BDDE|nr:glycosyltransferase family 9 protein [Rhodopila sp.]HVY15219.1 glycosyltransferase family 9 protein [Rhodopila sp.]